MVKFRSLAAAAVVALFLFPGVSAADFFSDAFDAAVADAGFSDIPDFSAAVAEAGFGDFEGQVEEHLQAFEDERDAFLEASEEARGGLVAFFEGLLAALIAERDELAVLEPGPDDFVLENKPGGVIDCTDGVCVTPAD